MQHNRMIIYHLISFELNGCQIASSLIIDPLRLLYLCFVGAEVNVLLAEINLVIH